MAKVVIDEERCKGCSLCIAPCPKKILRTSESTNSIGYHPTVVIDKDKCTGCCLCAIICPDLAIEVYK